MLASIKMLAKNYRPFLSMSAMLVSNSIKIKTENTKSNANNELKREQGSMDQTKPHDNLQAKLSPKIREEMEKKKDIKKSNSHSTQAENSNIEELVLNDHQKLKNLFEEYKKTHKSDKGKTLCLLTLWELSKHMIAEESALYPLIKKYVPNGDLIVTESAKDHGRAKQDFTELIQLDHTTQVFYFKFCSAMEEVFAHLNKEEVTDLRLTSIHCPKEERIKCATKFEERKKLLSARYESIKKDESLFKEFMRKILRTTPEKMKDILMGETFKNKA